MDPRTLDLEESRRILLGSDDEDGDAKPDDGNTISDDENNEKDNIVKLSSYTFSNSDQKTGSETGLSPGKSLTRGVSYQPSLMEDDRDEFGVGDKSEDAEKEEDSDGDFEPSKRNRASRGFTSSQYPNEDDDDNDDDEDDDDDDDDVEAPPLEGLYDPREFDHLPVDSEVQELFVLISKYRAQTIILDYKLKPFIPDYIPAVGDIDAFLKVDRPDQTKDPLGLTVVDEPLAGQSDPSVLDLQLRAISKHSAGKAARIKKVLGGEAGNKEVEKWILDISDLHRTKPPPSVNYRHPMPDIDKLMQVIISKTLVFSLNFSSQEWPAEFEKVLSTMPLTMPDASQVELETYIDIICSILDIPVYKCRIQSLHLLFSLYLAFNNSQHFGTFGREKKIQSRGFLDPL